VEILLDTHAFLWYMAGDSRLSDNAKTYIDNRENIQYLSTASLWEIAIKYSSGRLTLMEPYETLIPRLLQINRINVLNISVEHMSEVANLSFPDSTHKDPFDRLIIAQSKVEDIPVLSIDVKFDAYGINRLW
jgi:PIN domain nuclease of toxin-antitoxin system